MRTNPKYNRIQQLIYLQIESLSVNSIALYNSLCIEVGDFFLYLFISTNSAIDLCGNLFDDVILTFSYRTRRYLFKGPTPLCSSTRLLRPLLLNLNLLEATAVRLATDTTSCTHELFFEKPGFSLVFFVLVTAHSGKETSGCISSELSLQSFDRNRSHSDFISGRIQSCSSFTARARYRASMSISKSPFTSQYLVTKL